MRPLRIYQYLPEHDPELTHLPPMATNYKTGLSTRLPVHRTVVKGELRRVDFLCPETGDVVVQERRAYHRNILGLVQTRDMTIVWYDDAGEECVISKNFPKAYSQAESLAEIRRRRQTMVESAQSVAVALLGDDLSHAMPLLQELSAEKTAFIESGNAEIVASIRRWEFEGWSSLICDAVVEELTI